MLLICLAGCTVTVEPLPKKPVKRHSIKKHKRAIHPHETPTPTPTASPKIKHPMDLEPTLKPTPMIKVDQVTRLNLSDEPMI